MQMTKTTNAQSSTHHPQATTNRPSTSKKRNDFKPLRPHLRKKMIRFRNINHKTLALYDKTCNFAKIKYFSYRITVNKLVYE